MDCLKVGEEVFPYPQWLVQDIEYGHICTCTGHKKLKSMKLDTEVTVSDTYGASCSSFHSTDGDCHVDSVLDTYSSLLIDTAEVLFGGKYRSI